IASLFYYIVMHAAFGQTLGKMITGVRVVKNKDLAPIGLGHALARDIVPLLFIAVGLLAMPMFDFGIAEGKEATLKLPIVFLAIAVLALAWPILEVITMLFNRRRRAIHDFIAGTVVIRYLRSAEKRAKDKLSTASTAAT
ncbi:MAG: hypothetical protein HKN59_02650, partial [Gammaproteobacteria bacterium]|nr:hypothetical protein [Gammaproteobacteria bacterium]